MKTFVGILIVAVMCLAACTSPQETGIEYAERGFEIWQFDVRDAEGKLLIDQELYTEHAHELGTHVNYWRANNKLDPVPLEQFSSNTYTRVTQDRKGITDGEE